jgi:hypothetical protein
MINWQFFPKWNDAPQILNQVVECFEQIEADINLDNNTLRSNQVLHIVRPHLEEIGFRVERGNRADQKIKMPVLFCLNGNPEKSFEVDAYHEPSKAVIEIEAGRALTNHQFLKDFLKPVSCSMWNIL